MLKGFVLLLKDGERYEVWHSPTMLFIIFKNKSFKIISKERVKILLTDYVDGVIDVEAYLLKDDEFINALYYKYVTYPLSQLDSYFVEMPEVGEDIAIIDESCVGTSYKVRRFSGLRNGRIYARSRYTYKEKEVLFYQRLKGDSHPQIQYWFNGYHNNVRYGVIFQLRHINSKKGD